MSDNLHRGSQIAYVPNHADGKVDHPDVEYGFVTSVAPGKHAFCRYWRKGGPGELRTKKNSEATPFDNLVGLQSVDQEVVDRALAEWC